MKHVTTTLAAAAVSALLVCAPSARADETGIAGPIVGLEVNTVDSDQYGVYRGKAVINEGDAVSEYWWGGMVCAGIEPTVDQQESLADAVGKKVHIIPYWKIGGAGKQCLVGYAISTKKAVADVTR